MKRALALLLVSALSLSLLSGCSTGPAAEQLSAEPISLTDRSWPPTARTFRTPATPSPPSAWNCCKTQNSPVRAPSSPRSP